MNFNVGYYTSNPQEYREKVLPFLLKNECENNLNIGLINYAIESKVYATTHLFYVEDEKKEVVFAAVWTPPFGISISNFVNQEVEFQERVLKHFVTFLRTDPKSPVYGESYTTLTGCTGDKQPAKIFTDQWCNAVGTNAIDAKVLMHERIYSLRPHQLKTQPCNNESEYELVCLSPQVYDKQEQLREVLMEYWIQFEDDAGVAEATSTLEERKAHGAKATEVRVRNNLMFLVVQKKHAGYFTGVEELQQESTLDLHKVIVSLVGVAPGGKTPRVAPVYTPAAYRKNGFASFGVSRTCNELLNVRKNYATAICLYADLGFSTSNKIYMDIGFTPIVDVDMYTYEYKNKNSSSQ